MTIYVLVHGAFHGAWCWERVVPGLAVKGHQVVAQDLPGSGKDETPWSEITLETYGQAVAKILEKCDEPVVLVGHSMGGIAISRAAELMPSKVKQLVYLAADLLRNGESVMDVFTMQENAGSLAVKHFVQLQEGLATTSDDGWHQAYFSDVSDEDMKRIRPYLRPQATSPLEQPMAVTYDRWGSVPRAVIETTQDRVLNIEAQRVMQARVGECDPVITLNTSHSPFISAPDELSEALLQLS